MKKTFKKGISLAELLAVIVIMGVLATISVVIAIRVIENSRDNAVLADTYATKDALNVFCLTNVDNSICTDDSGTSFSLISTGDNPIDPEFFNYISTDYSQYSSATANLDSNEEGGFKVVLTPIDSNETPDEEDAPLVSGTAYTPDSTYTTSTNSNTQNSDLISSINTNLSNSTDENFTIDLSEIGGFDFKNWSINDTNLAHTGTFFITTNGIDEISSSQKVSIVSGFTKYIFEDFDLKSFKISPTASNTNIDIIIGEGTKLNLLSNSLTELKNSANNNNLIFTIYILANTSDGTNNLETSAISVKTTYGTIVPFASNVDTIINQFNSNSQNSGKVQIQIINDKSLYSN